MFTKLYYYYHSKQYSGLKRLTCRKTNQPISTFLLTNENAFSSLFLRRTWTDLRKGIPLIYHLNGSIITRNIFIDVSMTGWLKEISIEASKRIFHFICFTQRYQQQWSSHQSVQRSVLSLPLFSGLSPKSSISTRILIIVVEFIFLRTSQFHLYTLQYFSLLFWLLFVTSYNGYQTMFTWQQVILGLFKSLQ